MQKYTEALGTFNEFISGNTQDKYFRKYEGTIRNPYAQKVVNPTLKVKMVDNPFDTSFGLVGFNQESKPLESAREIAQRSNVVDSSTGKELKYKPNDFFSSMFQAESLVEARWDKDGVHEDSWGNQVVHRSGDWKTKDGKPYYETLGGRDTLGKNFLHWSDVLTTDGSLMNTVDFFDSDGLEKSLTGQTVKTIVQIGALFVPYLNTALLAGGIAQGMAGIYSTFSKAIIESSLEGNAPKSKAWQFSNSLDGWMNRFERSTSDEGSESSWGYENVTSLVGDVVEQLKQQKFIAKGIAKVPTLLKGGDKKMLDAFIVKNEKTYIKKFGKTLEEAIASGEVNKTAESIGSVLGGLKEFQNLEKATLMATKVGQSIGSNYMALSQTTEVYELLKSSGFDPDVVLAGTFAGALGMMAVMHTSLGKVAYMGMGPTKAQKAISPIIKDVIEEAAKATTTPLTQAGKMNFVKATYGKILKNTNDLWKANGEYGIKGYLSNMLKEGTEEVSEELVKDAVLAGAKYYEESLKSVTGFKSKKYIWFYRD